jgi:hypothetical protein
MDCISIPVYKNSDKSCCSILSELRPSPLGTSPLTGLLYQPRMIDDGDCGATGGMKTGRGNRSTRRKTAPVPLCPPQISYDLTGARNRAAAVGSQRLTARAMARSRCYSNYRAYHYGYQLQNNYCTYFL